MDGGQTRPNAERAAAKPPHGISASALDWLGIENTPAMTRPATFPSRRRRSIETERAIVEAVAVERAESTRLATMQPTPNGACGHGPTPQDFAGPSTRVWRCGTGRIAQVGTSVGARQRPRRTQASNATTVAPGRDLSALDAASVRSAVCQRCSALPARPLCRGRRRGLLGAITAIGLVRRHARFHRGFGAPLFAAPAFP